MPAKAHQACRQWIAPIPVNNERTPAITTPVAAPGAAGSLDAVAATVILEDFFAAPPEAREKAEHVGLTEAQQRALDDVLAAAPPPPPPPPSASDIRKRMLEEVAQQQQQQQQQGAGRGSPRRKPKRGSRK